jgi:nucleoside-diphosphate-sugar epimerase
VFGVKVLVTGGTGFLGSHIVDALIKDDNEIYCLVRDTTKASRLKKLGVHILSGDLLNRTSLAIAMRGIDCVIHAAAKVSDWGSWEEFKLNTIEGTENILFAASMRNVERFMHISTVDVYHKNAFVRGAPRISEDCLLEKDFGHYYYAKAKLFAERIVSQYQESKKISTIIIRPGTIYGPRDMVTFPRLIDFLKSKSAALIEGYDPDIGLVYVKDVANLCVQALKSNVAVSKIYNASADEDVHLKDFFRAICNKLNITIPVARYEYWQLNTLANILEFFALLMHKKTPPILTRVALRLFTFEQRFDATKAKNELNWIANTPFDRGITETVEWYKNLKK